MEAALIILDGWGIGTHDRLNAVAAAETPAFERLSATGAVGTLEPTGRAVGLPEGRAGNSEVGHLTIGAGRVVKQPLTKISDAIAEGSFRENDVLRAAFERADSTGERIHFIGLLSDGGVHADIDHLLALIDWAGDRAIEGISHVFTDGRDMDPTSGIDLMHRLERHTESVGTGSVGTVVGRYYAMDRDENWDRTKVAYDAIVERDAPYRADSGAEAIETAYARGETDEFIEPTVVPSQPGIEPGNVVIFFNFRGDRARQLTRFLGSIRPTWPFDLDPPAISLTTMTEYDRTFDLPVAYQQPQPDRTLGQVLSTAELTQLRIAESEKYAHVTYFLNGGREIEFPGEIRRIIPSPAVPTYDRQPEMSAAEVTETAISVIAEDDPDVMVLNYANPDMVGHTGNFDATVAAVEAVDAQLDRLTRVLHDRNAHILITADHGNADDMGTPDRPHTAHTTNPVPLIYCSPSGTGGGYRVRSDGELRDIAPTLLECLDHDPPTVMTGRSVLVKNS